MDGNELPRRKRGRQHQGPPPDRRPTTAHTPRASAWATPSQERERHSKSCSPGVLEKVVVFCPGRKARDGSLCQRMFKSIIASFTIDLLMKLHERLPQTSAMSTYYTLGGPTIPEESRWRIARACSPRISAPIYYPQGHERTPPRALPLTPLASELLARPDVPAISRESLGDTFPCIGDISSYVYRVSGDG